MNLNFGGNQNQETGYGRMGKELLRGLREAGVQTDTCAPPVYGLLAGGMDAESSKSLPVHANALWLGAPAHVTGWWKGQRTHSFTMWEAMGVPPGFRENVHEFDTLIVPSQQNLELFSKWNDNVRKVPLGINPDDWHFSGRRPVDDEFRFMTAGQGTRKGIDIATKAFQTVFGGFQPRSNRPRPVLVVKSRHHMPDVKGIGIQEIATTLDLEDEIALYRSAHCFLGLARGEGWGLMPFQAMAQGCPTILADAHGYAEFSHLASQKISCGLSEVEVETFLFGHADQWWEPDFDEVCAAMWDMYVNYDSYLEPAKESAEIIANEYTWADSARKLIDAMGGPAYLELEDIEEREWYKPSVLQFHIVTDKDCSYEVNGTVHKFVKGEDYWVFGDLKRMLYVNKNLDPSCLDDIHESGLTPEQLSEVDRYRSEKSRCYACGQMLNTDQSLDFDDEDVMELSP